MSLIAYRVCNFKDSSLRIIAHANLIIGEYQAAGYMLTLRQLYYQFVARGLIENTVQSYKRLGSIINDARLAGLVDWDAIEDRTRNLERLSTWTTPADIIDSAAYSYREDLWANQDYYPEVWVEKEALAGVIERIANRLRVPFLACRGYMSQSEMHAAAKRLEEQAGLGYIPVIFHLGDHDPSGMDMTRDNNDRLQLFAEHSDIRVERLALNMDQVRLYNPPPNPAKETDSRHAEYATLYGAQSWELDALDPATLDTLISDAVLELRDEERWKESLHREEEARESLRRAARRWSDVAEFLGTP